MSNEPSKNELELAHLQGKFIRDWTPADKDFVFRIHRAQLAAAEQRISDLSDQVAMWKKATFRATEEKDDLRKFSDAAIERVSNDATAAEARVRELEARTPCAWPRDCAAAEKRAAAAESALERVTKERERDALADDACLVALEAERDALREQLAASEARVRELEAERGRLRTQLATTAHRVTSAEALHKLVGKDFVGHDGMHGTRDIDGHEEVYRESGCPRCDAIAEARRLLSADAGDKT